MKMKIIALPKMIKRTPTGAYHNQLTHHMWLDMNASKEEMRERVADVLGWHDPKSVQYLYAQGKNLRKAELRDVENAESWDFGYLTSAHGFWSFKDLELEYSDSDMSSDSDFVSEKSGSHVSNNVVLIWQ